MTDFLLVAALVGTTLIVVDSTLFRPVRKLWPALLGCAQCFGFWVGASAGATGIVSIGRGRAIDAFIVGAATSYLSLLAYALLTITLGPPKDEGKTT